MSGLYLSNFEVTLIIFDQYTSVKKSNYQNVKVPMKMYLMGLQANSLLLFLILLFLLFFSLVLILLQYLCRISYQRNSTIIKVQ